MDGDDASLTPRKALWRSASWTARSSPRAAPSRPPKPGRVPLQPLAIARPPMLTEWPRPASDDSGHCGTPCPKNTAGNSYVSDREISRVAEHVYLGSDAAARDRAALRRHGITHVLNCVGSACPEYFRGELQYMTLWLHDSPGEDITSVLYDAFDYLEATRNARPPGRVLVHCLRGASRSAALVIAYLMWRRALPFDDALRAVRAVRNVTDPNLGFAAQLLQCQSRVHAQPPSPGSARRAYRMAPHSPYDPLHLVPKAVDPVRLDSRGAFVLHVPAAIFVWLGQRCEPAMASSAATAARQVVHYERTKGPIITVHEGSESPDFWDALRHPAPASATESTDLGEAGNRRVELYDLDFEIFRRALKGGVLPPVAAQGRASPTRLPARDSRWGQLRHKFHSGGAREFGLEANEEEEVKDTIRSPGSLSVESSTTTSADSASTPCTFSPASSSSSDWYSLSPTATKFVSGLPPVHTRKKMGKDSFSVASRPLAERRGGEAPPLVLPPPADEKSEVSPREIVMDWCLSPPFVSEMDSDQGAMDVDRPMSGTEVEEAVIPEDRVQPIHPVLFRWPGLAKVEVTHAGVLDSKSVFLLWAPESSLDTRKHKTSMLFVWLGKESQLICCQNASKISMEGEEGRQSYTDKIGSCFLNQMGLPEDTHIEIIREGKEPKQFLNSLFSVHRVEDSCRQTDK